MTISGVNRTFGSPLGYRSAFRADRSAVQIISGWIWTSYSKRPERFKFSKYREVFLLNLPVTQNLIKLISSLIKLTSGN